MCWMSEVPICDYVVPTPVSVVHGMTMEKYRLQMSSHKNNKPKSYKPYLISCDGECARVGNRPLLEHIKCQVKLRWSYNPIKRRYELQQDAKHKHPTFHNPRLTSEEADMLERDVLEDPLGLKKEKKTPFRITIPISIENAACASRRSMVWWDSSPLQNIRS